MSMKEYDLLEIVKDCRNSKQQHIKIEATSQQEAKQKAINIGV